MELTAYEEDLITRLHNRIYGKESRLNTSDDCRIKKDDFGDNHYTFGVNEYRNSNIALPKSYVDHYGANEIAHVGLSKSDVYVIEDESHNVLIESNDQNEISDFIKNNKDKYLFAYNKRSILSSENKPSFIKENNLYDDSAIFLHLMHHYTNVLNLLRTKKEILSNNFDHGTLYHFVKSFFSYFSPEDDGTDLYTPDHRDCIFGYKTDQEGEMKAFLDIPDSDHRYIKTSRYSKSDINYITFYGDNVNECFQKAAKFLMENYDTVSGEKIK